MENRWWEKSEVINTRVAGVFEGGGAKGVAYVGALNAVQEAGCWFNAVAGASAGALTALIIAAGLAPEEIEDITVKLLRGIKSKNVLGSLWNLSNGRGYYPQKKLRQELDQMIRAQVQKYSGVNLSGKEVTFKDLYAATEIELNIVCADVSQNRIRLFNHHKTPKCEVVDIAMASSAIPIAFKSFDLRVPAKDKGYWHTLVDGGVSSNFPIFVFKDRAFRKYIQHPDADPPEKIIGFLLKTEKRHPDSNFKEASFRTAIESDSSDKKIVYEGLHKFYDSKDATVFSKKAWKNPLTSLFALVFWVIGLIARVLDGAFKGSKKLRWSRTSKPMVNYFVDALNGIMGFVSSPIVLIFLIPAFIVGVKDYAVTQYGILQSSISCFENITSTEFSNWFFDCFWNQVSPPFFKLLAIVVLGFVGIILMLVNAVALTPIRRLLYGLGKTYVSGSFVTPWVEEMEEVISLEIPDDLEVLSFEMDNDLRAKAIQLAQEKTKKELATLLANWNETA